MLEGNVAEIEGTFTTSRGTTFDPDTVVLHYKSKTSSGTLTYGIDEIEKLRTGRYRAYVYLDTPGEWVFQWEANGTKRGLGEKKIQVTPRTVI